MPIGRIQLKHGLESSADFNTMLQAEAYYATDTERLMIANGDGTGLILPSKNEIDTKIGDLTSLTTTEKGSIVGAVNEIDNNLNLVQSGGLDGAFAAMPFVGSAPIVESGAIGNDKWTKWADGTMVYEYNSTAYQTVNAGAIASNSRPFPVPFALTPTGIVSPKYDTTAGFLVGTVRNVSVTGIWFTIYNGASVNLSIGLQLFVIGRWK
jgi:hypothetical protein